MHVKKLTNILISEDVAKSFCFYKESFGFELVLAVPFGSEEAVFSIEQEVDYAFCIISNKKAELMIESVKSIKEESNMKPEDVRPGSSFMYLEVADVDGIFQMMNGRYEIVKGLHETFYGMKEFYMKDADGNTLGLAEKA